ncbi:hypothetical protein QR680_015458 [Steinernema hermaphroditum]|uniref:Uncharacterized protein n=1 Tax=Steinernema hermaphroditum TaxID=289476 RepID=A0AA39LK90_9BILA|nr:hypothetical protein QR680_015458 [Steinernema hermaphroditum]
MDALPLFVINVMVWDFLGTLLAAVINYSPIMPTQCYRINGLLGAVTQSELAYHIVGGMTTFCTMNSHIVQFYAFPYRYMVIAHQNLASKIKRAWVIVVCIVVQACYGVPFWVFDAASILPFDDYPFEGVAPERRAVACFGLDGSLRNTFSMFVAVLTVALGLLSILFSLLLRRHFGKMVHLYSKQTLEMHRKFQRYLIVITSLHVISGAIPHIIGAMNGLLFYGSGHEMLIFQVTTLIIYVHGTLFFVAAIVTFKPYRQAVGRMTDKLFNKVTSKNSVVSVLSNGSSVQEIN